MGQSFFTCLYLEGLNSAVKTELPFGQPSNVNTGLILFTCNKMTSFTLV